MFEEICKERLENLKKNDINLVHSVTQRHLSLRKQKIDSIFLQRRLAALKESSESTESGDTDSIQFTEKDLNIPPEDYLEINSISDSIQDLFKYISSSDNNYVKAGLFFFKEYTIKDRSTAEEHLNDLKTIHQYKVLDVLKLLLQLHMGYEDWQVILEILWIIANLLATEEDISEYIQPLKTDDFCDVLIGCLNSSYCDIVETAIWVLSSLTSQNGFNDFLIRHPVFDVCLSLANQDQMDLLFLQESLEFIAYCCVKVDSEKNYEKLSKALKIFGNRVYSKNKGLLRNSYLGILNISNYNDKELIKQVINSGILVRILKFNYKNNEDILGISLKILANIFYSDSEIVGKVLKMGFIQFYEGIIEKYPQEINIRFIILGLLNIASNKLEFKLAVLNSKVFSEKLYINFLKSSNKNLVEDLVQLIVNISFGKNIEILEKFDTYEIMKHILYFIEVEEKRELLNSLFTAALNYFKLYEILKKEKDSVYEGHMKFYQELIEKKSMILEEEDIEKFLNKI